MTFSGVAQL